MNYYDRFLKKSGTLMNKQDYEDAKSNYVVPEKAKYVEEQPPEDSSFEEAVRTLMAYLADNHHPHVKAVVTSTHAELVEGLASYSTYEFIKD